MKESMEGWKGGKEERNRFDQEFPCPANQYKIYIKIYIKNIHKIYIKERKYT